MDTKKAYLIDPLDKQEVIMILSKIETYRIHGGSGTRVKGGPQDVVHDKKYLEREKNQFKAYFKVIIVKIKNVDKLVVFGPAETAEKFKKELNEHYKDVYKKLEGVFTTDSMTVNQKKVLVRSYFEKYQTTR